MEIDPGESAEHPDFDAALEPALERAREARCGHERTLRAFSDRLPTGSAAGQQTLMRALIPLLGGVAFLLRIGRMGTARSRRCSLALKSFTHWFRCRQFRGHSARISRSRHGARCCISTWSIKADLRHASGEFLHLVRAACRLPWRHLGSAVAAPRPWRPIGAKKTDHHGA